MKNIRATNMTEHQIFIEFVDCRQNHLTNELKPLCEKQWNVFGEQGKLLSHCGLALSVDLI